MPEDLLAPYRRGGTPAPAPTSPRAGKGYSAFSAVRAGGAKPQRLELRPKDGLAVARLYSALSEIAYDRADYTGILLIFPAGRAIRIHGKQLRPVADALLAGTCEYLAELKDGEVAPEGAPVIERMELLQPKAPAGPA
jgi:hypothetical protein